MSDRHSPHETEHRESSAIKGDRIRNRPNSLHRLLAWAVRGYEFDVPAGSKTAKMHTAQRIEEDGDPAFTGQARAFFGFNQGADDDTRPNDWRAIACALDEDGFYRTPMRAAIARIADQDRRRLLGALACNLYTPLDVTRAFGIPDWCAVDIMERSLHMLWSTYSDRPYSVRTKLVGVKSDAQLNAEAA